MCGHRAGRSGRRRLRFPESTPPGLNHSIVTGTLIDDPRLARSPTDEPIGVCVDLLPAAGRRRARLDHRLKRQARRLHGERRSLMEILDNDRRPRRC